MHLDFHSLDMYQINLTNMQILKFDKNIRIKWWHHWDPLIYANFTGFLPNANLYSKENLTSFIRDQIKVLDDFAWHLFLVPNFEHILKFSQMRSIEHKAVGDLVQSNEMAYYFMTFYKIGWFPSICHLHVFFSITELCRFLIWSCGS